MAETDPTVLPDDPPVEVRQPDEERTVHSNPVPSTIHGQIRVLDEQVYRAIAVSETPALDRAMRTVSTAANYSSLWAGIALLLALRPGRGRQAALEGVAAIGITSLVVNQGIKRVVVRDRPARAEAAVPSTRHVRMPGSTSFPSGHSASAFAFASTVGDALPLLAPPLHVLATLVAYSRVHTGVHYPADALAGSLTGLVVGNAVTAVSRWYRRHHR